MMANASASLPKSYLLMACQIAAKIAILFVWFLLVPASAVAEERSCRGDLNDASVGNLRVPPGFTCTLNRTRVKGSIKVEERASLHARGARVSGNVQGEGARQVSITQSSHVSGNVQLKDGGSARVLNSTVDGNVQVEANNSEVRIADSSIGGSVQVVNNAGRSEIYGNRITGNLQCKENRARPMGGSNRVRGNKEDQCSRL
jgi:hypothetical protein